jgi:hypothetical protein
MATVKIVQSLSAVDTVRQMNTKQQQVCAVNMQSLTNNRNPTTIDCRLMYD